MPRIKGGEYKYSGYPQTRKNPFLFKEECYLIQGAIFEVYRELGCGFLEPVYQECLEKEFLRRDIPYKPKFHLPVFYKGEKLSQTYIPEFLCFDQIIVEIKAVKEIADIHRAQMMNYLKASGLKVGLLVNLNHYPKAFIDRIIV